MGSPAEERVAENRELLVNAQQEGLGPTLKAYMKLSGPGWLQSAITLGGGSLASALLLGVLGGTSMLWLQLVAIICGVIMLSAISYVVLSTGQRPFQAINRHINPALGWGWIIATIMANVIWVMPQFGLCYEALHKNLIPSAVGDSDYTKMIVSMVLLVAAGIIVVLNSQQGAAAKVFDIVLKGLVGTAVFCFFGVVCYLTLQGRLKWGEIFAGFIPDLTQWDQPAGKLGQLLEETQDEYKDFWSKLIVKQQRNVMIGAAATAVGINMTFLLPYSMLNRGWDKPFRGLAKFDLSTGMAIPYLLVTSCVVIAAASVFHGAADKDFLSQNVQQIQSSTVFGGAVGNLEKRFILDEDNEDLKVLIDKGKELEKSLADATSDSSISEIEESIKENKQVRKDKVAELVVGMPESERKLAAALVKRNAFQLSKSLSPFLGNQNANLIFGVGVFAMGFSTIIILMLINGYAFCEMFGIPNSKIMFVVGCLFSGIAGVLWPMVWAGESRFWLTILASTFGMMLLPIAYITFFMMMNSTSLMGKEKPHGIGRLIWNLLMAVAVVGAIVGAGSSIYSKATDKNPLVFYVVVGMAVVFGIAVVAGFFHRRGPTADVK